MNNILKEFLLKKMSEVPPAYLNHWFATYEEAKKHQKSVGGFLLPYKNQFFICSADYVQALGWDPNDANWALIHFDLVKPNDDQAYQLLMPKRVKS